MKTSQHGAALIVALLLLIVITLLGLASMRTTTLELRMAANHEAQLAAFEHAQAIVDAAIADDRNTIVVGDTGNNTCIGAAPPGTSCTSDRPSTGLADGTFSDEIASGRANVVVTRLAPLYRNAPPGVNTSADKFQAATFSVQGSYDDAAGRNGRTAVTEGVLVLIPNTM